MAGQQDEMGKLCVVSRLNSAPGSATFALAVDPESEADT